MDTRTPHTPKYARLRTFAHARKRKTAPWYDQIKAPIRAVNIGGLFVLERWILPTFTKWGEETGIVDQHSFSEKCGELGTCDELKVSGEELITPYRRDALLVK